LCDTDPKDNVLGFRFNRARGGGHCFGPDVTRAFLANNGLSFLIRSHEVCMQGVQMLHGGLCATVFSAPNYCGDMGNLGAVIRFMEPDSMKATAVQFSAAPRAKAIEDSTRQPELSGNPQVEGGLPQEDTKPWWQW
jgi:serine/threonine-protein phosphatase 5